MLTLSESAVEVVDRLLCTPEIPDNAGLRIRPAGESQLVIEIAAEPVPGDLVVEERGARVFVDSAAATMVGNAELDARMKGDRLAFELSM